MKPLSLPGLILLPALLFTLLFSGCGTKAEADNIPGQLSQLMARIYENAPNEDWPKRETYPIRSENMAYFLGVETLPMEEGLASEALSPAIPHSVCLIRLSDETAAETVKTQIKQQVDPHKWIFTGVEDEDVIVDSIGDLVILILSDDAGELHRGFLSLRKN